MNAAKQIFTANLNDASVIPPVNTTASGTAKFIVVSPQDGEISNVT